MDNIIFGIRPVAEAIEAGRQIEKLYIRKGAEGQLMTELKDLLHPSPRADAGGAGRKAQPPHARQPPGRRGADFGHRICRVGRHPGTGARGRDAAGGDLRRGDRRPQFRRHRPLGRVRRGARPGDAAEELGPRECRGDPLVGRGAGDDPGLPCGVDPQYDKTAPDRRVSDRRRNREEPQTALRRRFPQAYGPGDGCRGYGHLERGAQTSATNSWQSP